MAIVSLNVAVFGAAGKTGRLVVERALEQGHRVTAVVHTAPPEARPRERLTTVVADALDPASLRAALMGKDAVVSTIGVARLGERSELVSTATRNISAAMGASGIRRLVVVSVHGAGGSRRSSGFLFDKIVRPAMRLFAPGLHYTVYEDKERMESDLTHSTLDWTAVRPCGLDDRAGTGRYRAGESLKGGAFAKVARADVATFIVTELETNAFVGAAPSLLPQ